MAIMSALSNVFISVPGPIGLLDSSLPLVNLLFFPPFVKVVNYNGADEAGYHG